MQPRIETITEKKLIGQKLNMTFATNKTAQLWQSFMPRRREITSSIGTSLYSLQVYLPSHFDNFDPNNAFDKWALVEVANFDHVPDGMEAFTLIGGLYAVFAYKGSSTDTRIFEYIFTNWLPSSGYALDDRPHFEILGDQYKNEDPNSEEEIWIPIKKIQDFC
jgi:AraC family transcriptional regulator